MENMFGIAALIFSVGAAVALTGIGVHFMTGAGREGVRSHATQDNSNKNGPAD